MLRFNLPDSFILRQKNNFFFLKGALNSWLCIPKALCADVSSNVLSLKIDTKDRKKKLNYSLLCSFFHSFQSKLRLLSLGYFKIITLQGVGFRYVLNDSTLSLFIGFSAPVVVKLPNILTITSLSKVSFRLEAPNKDLVNSFAHALQKFRFPDAYKGKGVFLAGQSISLKQRIKS